MILVLLTDHTKKLSLALYIFLSQIVDIIYEFKLNWSVIHAGFHLGRVVKFSTIAILIVLMNDYIDIKWAGHWHISKISMMVSLLIHSTYDLITSPISIFFSF